MSNHLTIVTALFDIGRGNLDGQWGRDFAQYKEWFSQMLPIDLPMVIFCEESLDEFIWKYRKPENTSIIHRTTEDIKNFFLYNFVQKIRINPEWYGQEGWIRHSPQGTLELYNPLVMSKPQFMLQAILKNPFDSEYFLWLDAGVSHTTPIDLFDPPFEDRIIKHLDKILFLAFYYEGDEIHGFNAKKFDEYAGEHADRVVRAMMWGGPKHLLVEMIPLYNRWLFRTLTDGYMGTEENILTLLTYQVPEMINLHALEGGFIKHFLEELKRE